MTNAKKFASILVPAAYLTSAVTAWAADPADASGALAPAPVANPAPLAAPPTAPAAVPNTPSNSATAPATSTAPSSAPMSLTAGPTATNPPAPTTAELPPPPKDEPATVFNSKSALGGYGGLDVSYSRFAGKDVALLCLEGGLLIDHAFTIGAAACGIAPDRPTNQINPAADPTHRTEFGYGGAMLRYRVLAHKYFNLSIGTIVGAGAIVSDAYDDDDHEHHSHNPDTVFVFDPQISANVNLTKWMRLGVTGGYHFVAGIDTKGLSHSDVAAPSIGGQILFGEF